MSRRYSHLPLTLSWMAEAGPRALRVAGGPDGQSRWHEPLGVAAASSSGTGLLVSLTQPKSWRVRTLPRLSSKRRRPLNTAGAGREVHWGALPDTSGGTRNSLRGRNLTCRTVALGGA